MFGSPKTNPHGWQTKQLAVIADFYSGNSLPEGEPYLGQSDGYMLLKVSDLNLSGNEDFITTASSWSLMPGAKAGTCNRDAVIFPKRGGAIATNKKRKLTRPAILDPNLMAVSPKDGAITTDYLYAWFQSFRLEEITSGSSVPQLNKQDLAPLKVAVPPMSIQVSYSDACALLSERRHRALAAVQACSHLFASLQSRAFSGQL